MDALGKVQISAVMPNLPKQYDPNDERIKKCVVCFNDSGAYKYVCPQCVHATCIECLENLKNPVCPHCRYEAIDIALTQNIAHVARRGSRLYDDAAALADVPLNVPISLQVAHSRCPEEKARRNTCFCCSTPSSASNYICPCCSASICYECAKKILVARPRCPSCGDIDQVAATVPQYIAANEAWVSAAQFTDAISRSISDMTSRISLSKSAEPTHHPHGPMLTRVSSLPANPSSFNSCVLCRTEASMFDHVCPVCSSTTCGTCISTKLKEPYRCPCCNDSERNTHNMYMIASAHQARKSWGNFWGSVVDGFGGQPQIESPSRLRTETV